MSNNKETNVYGNIEKLTQIDTVNGNVIINNQEPNAKKILERGKKLLQIQSYQQAIETLEHAIRLLPTNEYAHYYLALALLDGKRPKLLKLSTIKVIEQHLQSAINLQSKFGEAYVLWAMVKHDYYVLNGMRDRSPSYQDLLNINWSITVDQAKELLQLTQIIDNPVWKWLSSKI